MPVLHSKAFAFRHRVGSIDWKTVSEVDITTVVEDGEIGDLQSILDAVTFCEFREIDVKKSSIQNTAKLVQLMQLMIEYLLYCQESQCSTIRDINNKYTSQKAKTTSLKRENISLKEDIKIYQRQLLLLQQSILKQQTLLKNPSTILDPRVIFDPQTQDHKSRKENDKDIMPIMESVLKHERETRDFLKDIIENQRNAFVQELHRFVEVAQNQSENLRKVAEQDLRAQADSIVEVARNAIQSSTLSIATERNKDRAQSQSHSDSSATAVAAVISDMVEREATLRAREKLLNEQFQDRERQLEQRMQSRERELLRRQHMLDGQQAKIDAAVQATSTSVTNATSTSSLQAMQRLPSPSSKSSSEVSSFSLPLQGSANPKDMILSVALHIVSVSTTSRLHSCQRRLAFIKWQIVIAVESHAQQQDKWRNEADEAAKRELQLVHKAADEKERSMVDSARYNSLNRKVESERQGLDKMLRELTTEREVAMAEVTRCNSLCARLELEKQKLQEQMEILQNRLQTEKEAVIISQREKTEIESRIPPPRKRPSIPDLGLGLGGLALAKDTSPGTLLQSARDRIAANIMSQEKVMVALAVKLIEPSLCNNNEGQEAPVMPH
eukprot:gene3683-7327_t